MELNYFNRVYFIGTLYKSFSETGTISLNSMSIDLYQKGE
jgi:hypothetical protein